MNGKPVGTLANEGFIGRSEEVPHLNKCQVPQATQRKAALYIASRVGDAGELALLMDVLGIELKEGI
jgi:hypothetical protein